MLLSFSYMSRIQDMFGVGAHYGYTRSRRHPTTKPYIFGSKNHSDVIDLEKTEANLIKSEELIKAITGSGRQVIFVGTKPEIRDLVKTTAESLGMPYVDERWIGGTLTNWKQIKIRVDLLEDLGGKQESNNLTYKTKKEKLLIERKIEKLNRRFGGLSTLKGTPAAIIVIDAREEENAVSEAAMMNIPIVAVVNTDNDIRNITHPIVANDNNRKSVDFFLKQFAEAMKG
jgi:small subunit ribosomal protein S2